MAKSNEKFDVIMFNMSSFYDWDHGIRNRNYNILTELAHDEAINKIVSVDFLPIGLKNSVKHYFQNIMAEPKTAEMVYGDLTSACYQRSDKIFVYSTIDSLFGFKTVARELRRIEKILGLKNIIFWSYNPMFIEFIGRLNEKLFVFDTVDNWSEHPEYTKLLSKDKLLSNYQAISKKADIIFTVSKELLDFYKLLNRENDVHWIPNGVDWDLFNNENANQENELSKIKKPIIGYIGTIEKRVDIDLLHDIATKHIDKELVLCGPIWDSVQKEFKQKLSILKNVRTLGRIPYEDAPSYINKFDVAIIPHKMSNLVKSMNPMKLYEYLACGKAIVTTPGAGTDIFKDLLYIAENSNDFVKLIDTAQSEDSPEKQAQRRASVKNLSWANRVNEMLNMVYSKL